MNNITGNSSTDTTTLKTDDLSQITTQPLMVTEPVTASSSTVSGNSPADPKTKVSTAYTPSAIPEPTVTTPDKSGVPESIPNAPKTAIPASNINADEEQAISDPGFTVNSSSHTPKFVNHAAAPAVTKKSNAAFYLGLVVLFLAISVPTTVYLNQKARTQTSAKTFPVTKTGSSPDLNIIFYKPEVISKPTAASDQYQDIAYKNLVWIASQKTPENKYYVGQITKEGGSRVDQITDDRLGLYAAWSKYNNWKKTKNDTLLTSLETDLAVIADPVKTNSYQPDFWSCKLLYQIGTDPAMSTNIQNFALSACNRAVIGIISFDMLENPGKPLSDYPETDLNRAFEKYSGKPLSLASFGWDNFLNFFINNAALVSDYLAKAWWTDDGQYLSEAKKTFNYALLNYQRLNQINPVPEACVLGEASLDLFTATKEEKYLTFAQNLFDRESQNISAATNVFAKINCLILVKDLNRISENERYKTYLTDKTVDLLTNNFDNTQGNFYTKTGKTFYSMTKDNGLISAFLSSL